MKSVFLFALFAGFVVACVSQQDPAATDVCGQASAQFATCGTELPLLNGGPCTGTAKIMARCVVDHAHDCDELASLFSRIDQCVSDVLDGGDALLPPATDLPVPALDGGHE